MEDEIAPLPTEAIPADVVRDPAMTPVQEPTPLADNATPEQAPATPGDVQEPAAPVPKPVGQPKAAPRAQEIEQPKAFVPPPPPTAQELDAHTAQIAQDFNSGAIHPKTYRDLMPEGTIGKIGTFFGLLLSGAGSGLSGQPNAVLQMMDKTIANDLAAQQNSAENKRNLYALSLQHEQNQTAATRAHYENMLAQASIDKKPEEIAYIKSQIKNLDIDNKLKATTIAHNTAVLGMINELAGNVNGMAPGQQKDAATVALNDKIKPAAMTGIQGRNAQTAGQLGLRDALHGPPAQDETQYQRKQQIYRATGMKEIADANDARHVPGIPGQASIALNDKDREQLQGGQALLASLQRLKEFSQNNPHPLINSAEDDYGKSLAAQVQTDYRQATNGGMYKEGEQHFISSIVPEDPTTWSPTANVIPKINAVLDETNARQHGFLKSRGFTVGNKAQVLGPDEKKTARTAQTEQEIERTDKKTGKTAVFDMKTKKFLRYK